MNDNHNELATVGQYPEALSSLPFAERSYSLHDAWKTLRRRRNILLLTLASCLLIAVGYILFTPRLYQADAKMEILKQSGATDLGDPAQASASLAADALDFNLAAQTQVDVLQSRGLAMRVMQELRLNDTQDYKLRGKSSSMASDDSSPEAAYALKRFQGRLKVGLISGTRLISVSFLDRSPQRSAQVVNQLIADFIDHNFQTRFAASSQATSFLSSELEQMKRQVDESQANVVRLQQQSGIYGVDETNNATNARLDQLNAQVTAAQSNLALKRSVYHLAMTRNPEILSGMIGAQGTGANTANAPLQLLRQQQADAAANYAELNAHYGSQYPKVLQAGEKLRAIQASIESEINRLTGEATAEYKVATDTEAAATSALAAQKQLAAKMNHDAILYTSAKHEADTSRDLYEQLLHRLKEAGVLAGIRSSNLKVLDAAIAPAKPAEPMVLLGLLAAIGVGLVLGALVAFLVDAFDSTVRDPEQIESATFAPVLGMVPMAAKSLPRAAVVSLTRTVGDAWEYQTTARAPRSVLAEAFRSLRTAVLAIVNSKQWTVLAVTSTSESEGKSFTTFNLASAIAQSGRTVVVVDADLRKHTLSDSLGLGSAEGLDEAAFDPAWQKYVSTYSELPGLFILPAGQQGHQPADLLGSRPMAELIENLRNSFDIVLIDTPSILAVTDTVSLSSAVDGVLIVAKCGQTQQHSLMRTISVLRRGGAKVMGVILNGIDFDSSDFYYYWGRQTSGYAATEAQILSPAPQILPSHRGTKSGLAAAALIAVAMLASSLSAQEVTATVNVASSDSAIANAVAPASMAPVGNTRRLLGTPHTHAKVAAVTIVSNPVAKPHEPSAAVPIQLGKSVASPTPQDAKAIDVKLASPMKSSGPDTPATAPTRICIDCMIQPAALGPHSELRKQEPATFLLAALEIPAEEQALAGQQQERTRLPLPGQIPDAAQGIVIGVGDTLNISVYDAPELAQSVRVAADGKIHITLLGDVQAEGLQPSQLEAAIEAAYQSANLLRKPNVTVELKDFATQGLTVEGEVARPGIYPIYSARSLVDVLALAGGRTDTADSHVTIRRHKTQKLERVELQQNDSDQQANSDVRVFPGDTVIVPRAGLTYVMGSVTKPGGYIMRDGGTMTVLQAISEAQGTTKLASRDTILLLRKTNDGTITIRIALKDMERGKVPDQRLLNGDVLYVPASGGRTFLADTSAITASLSGAALYAIAR